MTGKRMLLHVCCGPCSTSSIERLIEDGWTVDVFFSNSNIFPEDEYRKRLEGAKKTAEYFKTGFIVDEYNHEAWLEAVAGFEDEPEKGLRCGICFAYSLGRTAERAAEGGYDGFTTTLSVSPHKVSRVLFEKGRSAADNLQASFIEYDFKKKDGYKKSIELSKKLGLYRQQYCGCEFSFRTAGR